MAFYYCYCSSSQGRKMFKVGSEIPPYVSTRLAIWRYKCPNCGGEWWVYA